MSAKNLMQIIAPVALVLLFIISAIITVEEPSSLEVVTASPSQGNEDVDIYPNVTLEFNLPVSASSFKEEVSMIPSATGEWEVSGRTCSFQAGSRLDSNTEYTITVPKTTTSTTGRSLATPYSLSFTTGNTSYRVVGNGTSAQLDYIALTMEGEVFATSMKTVAEDETNYTKSPLYIEVYKERFGKLRKFPIVVGKEDEFKAVEDQIIGMKIGQSKEFSLGPTEIFGVENQSLIYTHQLEETINYTEEISFDMTIDAFNGNTTPGAKGIHPLWGWNISMISFNPGPSTIINEPEDGMILSPYGWDTLVTTGQDNISVSHKVNDTHINKLFAISGTFPEQVFLVREVNITGGYVLLDENWPPIIIGQTTNWNITVYDIKISES